MNKRGFVFTIVTLFLFLALLSLSYSYFTRGKTTQEMIALSAMGSKVHYIEDNIATSYWDILNISLANLTKNKENGVNETLVLYFDKFMTLPQNPEMDTEMMNYTNITRDRLVPLWNTEVAFEGGLDGNSLDGNFTLIPYNSEFFSTTNEIVITTDPGEYRKIKSIRVDIEVPIGSEDTGVIVSRPVNDSAATLTNITINWTGLLANTITRFEFVTVQLNPDDGINVSGAPGGGNKFYILSSLEPLIRFNVEFGKYGVGAVGGKRGTLRLTYQTTNQIYTAKVARLEIVYFTINETTKLQTESVVFINPKVGSITKRGPIILVEEGYYKYANK